MPPQAAAAVAQQGDCCRHGQPPRWHAGGAGEPLPFYLPQRKRLSVDGNAKPPGPRICIWECDGEAGDITCDIVAAPFRRSCSARPTQAPAAPFFRMMTPPPPRPQRVVEAEEEASKPGKAIRRGHRSYGLMLNLQLGISYSVGKSSALPFRKLLASDFDPREKVWTRFPPEGSKLTPPHHSVDFRWKDYCPAVFRHLRKLFGVDPADYMLAICGNHTLRELASPGKSGSCFFVTQDDRFMIKTVKKAEVKVLIRMLRSYYEHVRQHKSTLLTRFYGTHCIKQVGCPKPGSDDDVESPPAPSSPTYKRTHEYNLILHVKEVIDRGPLLMDGTDFYPDDDEDLSRKHKFKTWRGKIDGTGPGLYGEA